MGSEVVLPEPLTPRELDILQALAEGLSSAEIAGRLVLAAGTVKWYLKQLYGKLDAHSRKEAVSRAQELGLVARVSAADEAESRDARCRLINPLPQDVSGRYVGNAEKLALLADMLRQPARLISIYGRAGAGKTALACKALGDLCRATKDAERPDGIVCLSAAGAGLEFGRLFSDLGRLLSEQDQAAVEAIARNAELRPAQKSALLLEKLAGKRMVLLLDNLETAQDPETGALLDPALQQFVEMSLAQSSALTLLVTSREPLLLPRALKTWEHLISLEDGLPVADAAALLRQFDPGGLTGLRDAPADELCELVKLVQGFPRALEAAAGMLLEDPLLSLAELKQNLGALQGEITATVVEQALAQLNDDSMLVLQALAVFGEPVTFDALSYLLEPYLLAATVRTVLGRLIRACFVKANRATRQFALHPLDQSYCYNRIPSGSLEDAGTEGPAFSKAVLHRRAAAYYHGLRLSRSSWRRLSDLAPQLSEFRHLLSAGAHDDAARVLLEIDRDYLWEWEYKDLLGRLYQQLGDNISDPRLAIHVARRKAWLRFFDPSGAADREFARLLDEARRQNFTQEEADALDDLAQTYRRGGRELEKAAAYHEQALALYRRTGDRRGQAEALGGIGSALLFSDPLRAVAFLQEAADIQRDLGNAAAVCYSLSMQGAAYQVCGRYDLAREPLLEAVRVGQESDSLASLTRAYGALAVWYVALGEIEQGRACIEEAIRITKEQAGVPVTGGLLYVICWTAMGLALQGAGDRAVELLQGSIQDAAAVLPLWLAGAQQCLSMVLLLKGDVGGARAALAFEPEVLLATRPGDSFWVGALLIKTGEAEAAEQFLRGLLEAAAQGRNYAAFWVTGTRPLTLLVLGHAGLALLKNDQTLAAAATGFAREAATVWNVQTAVLKALIGLLLEEPGGALLRPVHDVLSAVPRPTSHRP